MRNLLYFHQEIPSKTIQTLFLLFYFLPCSFSQNPAIDSLETLFATKKNNAQKLELLQQMVDIASMTDFQEALTYTKRGLKLSDESGDKNWQPKFYEMHGRMYANLMQLDTASLFFDKAMVGYQEIGNKKGQATTAFKISWVHKIKGNIEKAMEADLQALRMMEELDDKKGIAGALERVAEDLMRQGQASEALEYAKKAINICQEHQFEEELFYAYSTAGDAAIYLKENQLALDYYNKSLALAQSLNLSIADIAGIANSRGNAFKKLGKYEAALEDYQKCLALGQEANYNNAIKAALANIGEVNLLLGQYQEALPYQLKTIELQEADNDFSNLEENYRHTSTIYEHLGDYKTALTYERKSRAVQDSTMSIQSNVAISELKTQYETEKKEAMIATQQQQLYQKSMVQWLIIGVAVLLAGFLFFLYRSYQARTQTNKMLEAKNTENELLLKEIHHRVKNNLEIVSSLLELQSAQINDQGIKAAMLEGQNRVHSIGIVHQKLYQGKNLGTIEMKDYFLNLSESILDSYGAEERITIECAMEKLEVDIDTAVPLGLIVNELLTNTLKYAFPNGQKGRVRIELKKEKEDRLHLKVADDGVGKSGVTQGTGFGGQLVSLLTRQLSGSMREEIINGTTIYFDFNLTKTV